MPKVDINGQIVCQVFINNTFNRIQRVTRLSDDLQEFVKRGQTTVCLTLNRTPECIILMKKPCRGATKDFETFWGNTFGVKEKRRRVFLTPLMTY